MDNQLLLLPLTWPCMDNLTVVWGSWRRRGMGHWDNPVLQVTTDHFVALSTVYLMCLSVCNCASVWDPHYVYRHHYVGQCRTHTSFVCLWPNVITHRIHMHHYPGEHMSRYCRRAEELCHRTHEQGWPPKMLLRLKLLVDRTPSFPVFCTILRHFHFPVPFNSDSYFFFGKPCSWATK